MGAYQEWQDDLRQLDLLDGEGETEHAFQRFICKKLDEQEVRIHLLEGIVHP
jgi:hypothetical protein